ncbi:hypothetical protein PQ462_06625 [Flavobacterium sp. KACC 22758]|uniref:hypothetical protein n=1 Tax=Flavobacterium sp. KACC 22758 TaxID=3025667 RepID=UPI002367187C|nr:hypothetical protein [Flavobacterium sp. KACC 22758]WDF61035.1 hypothetical protein PQ462_06625 [Flavobacterium sp. KACC 22758]
MAKIILIRGERNSGKTTTTGLVYSELLKISEIKHKFNNKDVTKNSLTYDNETGDLIDFNAVIKIKGKTIGIVSAGDVAEDLKAQLSIFIQINIDIIICCARSRNVDGSSYKMIITNFAKQNPILKEVWSKFSPKKEEKKTVKKQTIEEIINLVTSNI